MEKEIKEPELLKEYLLISSPTSNSTAVQQYRKVVDSAIFLVSKAAPGSPDNQRLDEGHMLFQMTVFKSISVLELLNGIQFSGDCGVRIKSSLDPFAVWPIVRSQFEAYCLFNNIYVSCSSESESIFKYNLWVLSGLNYRQSNLSPNTPEKFQEKAKVEALKIAELEKEVFDSDFLKGLGAQEEEKTKKFIENKKYQVFLNENKKLVDAAWHELFVNTGAKSDFKKLYGVMSMSTHPSNVSVFQFRDIFKEKNAEEMMYLAVKFSSILISCMIRDYCVAFPKLIQHFNELPKINQLIINANNSSFRKTQYKINNLAEDLWGGLSVADVDSFLSGNK